MAIGRITGPMLFSNLERQGTDLAIDGNLIYADVTNRRVGINNASPAYSFDSPGNVRLANIIITGSTLSAHHNSSIFIKNSFRPCISITSSSHLSGGPPLVSTHFAGYCGNFMKEFRMHCFR